MPGGMIDSDDVNDAKYTFEKEMQEELNLTNFINIQLFKKFNVKEARGPVTTFVFTAISNQTPRAGDDAADFEWVEVGENFELLNDFLKANRNRFAMKHHFDILTAFAKGK
jgi:ADP-ribose pyrophosphatase YjhB (NUDIX family)